MVIVCLVIIFILLPLFAWKCKIKYRSFSSYIWLWTCFHIFYIYFVLSLYIDISLLYYSTYHRIISPPFCWQLGLVWKENNYLITVSLLTRQILSTTLDKQKFSVLHVVTMKVPFLLCLYSDFFLKVFLKLCYIIFYQCKTKNMDSTNRLEQFSLTRN